MQRNAVETMLGAFVLVVAIVFVFFFQKTADLKPTDGYELKAKFSQINGLERGTPVRISGVNVGKVTGFELDTTTYLAIVSMNINEGIELPYDTAAMINSASLLGGKYLSLEPGGDMDMLQAGDTIEFTQSTPGIEALLGKAIYNMSGNDQNNSKEESAPAATPDAPVAQPKEEKQELESTE
jgi:phospholipid/cholesterol/gamma-HCH transport system substrate-binding protein